MILNHTLQRFANVYDGGIRSDTEDNIDKDNI